MTLDTFAKNYFYFVFYTKLLHIFKNQQKIKVHLKVKENKPFLLKSHLLLVIYMFVIKEAVGQYKNIVLVKLA